MPQPPQRIQPKGRQVVDRRRTRALDAGSFGATAAPQPVQKRLSWCRSRLQQSVESRGTETLPDWGVFGSLDRGVFGRYLFAIGALLSREAFGLFERFALLPDPDGVGSEMGAMSGPTVACNWLVPGRVLVGSYPAAPGNDSAHDEHLGLLLDGESSLQPAASSSPACAAG